MRNHAFLDDGVDPAGERIAPRRKASVAAQISSSALKRSGCRVVNLSRMGCRIDCAVRLNPGDVVLLTLPTLAARLTRVAWWKEGAAGLAFHDTLSLAVLERLLAVAADRRPVLGEAEVAGLRRT